MAELARVIGLVAESGGKKLLASGGKEIVLLNAGGLQAGCAYRIVGAFEGDSLRVDLARKLEGFDLRVYEKALEKALG